ncbi:MAG: RluA family pseudouridine synthase [bacterium]|nr:RluA family pseudouridine synthase [bacterium]
MFLFCEALHHTVQGEAKAKTARRVCENFPSGKLFVGESLAAHHHSPMEIIYEDNDILAVNKPAGLLVHGDGRSKEKTLVDWLAKKYPEIKNVGDNPEFRPGIVHRLDKDTSGILLIAKNQKAFEYLKKLFQEREIQKKYIALVLGEVKKREGIIDLPIGKSKKDFRKKASVGKLTGKIREAVTEYKVLEKFSDFTLVEAWPKTGRTHQIRAHFKAIGHPLACDSLYGPKNQECPDGLNRHFLHAASLEFVSPDGSRIMLEADLPEDLEKTLSFLRKLK